MTIQIQVLKTALEGITREINSRRQMLWCMKQNIIDPMNVDQVYRKDTIYKYGPLVILELKKLQQIRKDLKKCLRKELKAVESNPPC